MYKHIFLLFLILNCINYQAQQIEDKKIQMGIVFGTSLNINKSESKIVNANNPGYDFTVGMNLIKNFNKNLGFNTGIEFDFSTMKYQFHDSLFYDFKDNLIYSKSDKNNLETYKEFNLLERKQKPIFLSIPTMFIFKTDFIGYNRYFAKFGMRHNFVLKEVVTDKDYNNNINEKMNISKELAFYSGSIGIFGGTEWNYSGSSTIQFELGYLYGITNLQRTDAIIGDVDKHKTLYTKDNNNIIYKTFNSTRNQLSIKISFLF
jgi:hypothetical protein